MNQTQRIIYAEAALTGARGAVFNAARYYVAQCFPGDRIALFPVLDLRVLGIYHFLLALIRRLRGIRAGAGPAAARFQARRKW